MTALTLPLALAADDERVLVVETLQAGARQRRRAAELGAAEVHREQVDTGADPRSGAVRVMRILGEAAALERVAGQVATAVELSPAAATPPPGAAAGGTPGPAVHPALAAALAAGNTDQAELARRLAAVRAHVVTAAAGASPRSVIRPFAQQILTILDGPAPGNPLDIDDPALDDVETVLPPDPGGPQP